MHAYYADQFVLPLPEGHRFPMAKYRLLRDAVAAHLPGVALQVAPPASDSELALAHAPGYIDAIATGTLPAPAQREIGFPWSPAMAERARRSVGATIAACRVAMAACEGAASRAIWLAARTTLMPTRAAAFACSTTWPWPRG